MRRFIFSPGGSFESPQVWAITLLSPVTFLIAYLALRRIAARRDYRQVGISMMFGVWLLGGLFMIGISAATGGFAGPNRFDQLIMFLLFSWFPLLTWIMATYDGSLGALIIVTLGALLFWGVRRYRRVPHVRDFRDVGAAVPLCELSSRATRGICSSSSGAEDCRFLGTLSPRKRGCERLGMTMRSFFRQPLKPCPTQGHL